MKTDAVLCAKCKGARRLCGRPKCPLLARIETSKFMAKHLHATTLFGASPPSILVGEWNYPNIFLGPNVPPVGVSDAQQFEDPVSWWGEKSLDDVIRLRSSVIHSKFSTAIKSARQPSGLLEKTQELALSIKPVDTEVEFYKPPRPNLNFDGFTTPVGPSGKVKRFDLVGNPTVPRKIDQLVYDIDAMSLEAMTELYASGISVYDITRLLSVGLLGRKFQRRIVPTRWAITATDANMAKLMLEKVKTYPQISEIQLYTSDYLDNHYETLLLPGEWSFEMIEIWLPRTVWVQADEAHVTDVWEKYDGKVSAMDGGYFAMKLPAVEFLEKIKRQATVIAFREVGAGYVAPLGVWAVRESVKHCFDQKPKRFDNLETALKDIFSRLKTQFSKVWPESKLLKDYKYQKRLTQFLTLFQRAI